MTVKEKLAWTIACATAAPIATPALITNKIKETAENHPKATMIVAGMSAGVVGAFLLVDGEKAHPDSFYKKVFPDKE